jgi:glucosamine--fructose-6-phosphate aminotransferase (isomerizing)
MKRCTRCIIPETANGIQFDENGLCQLCRDYKKIMPKGEEELRKEIEGYVNKEAEFNCVVPVSGGRDSSYALYYAKEILGLRPIAVHNDNDFETEIARENMGNMTKALNVPLVRVSSKEQISKKIVTEKFKMNAPFGPGLVVDQTCEACKYGYESVVYNTTRKRGIQLIIWGDSVEESTSPFHLLFEHKTPSKWERLFSPGCLSYFKYKYLFEKMKRAYGPDSPKGLKEIHLYDYIEWDRKDKLETIQNKLGWSKPNDSVTSWRIDCSLVPLVSYLTLKAYGVSKIELGFSSMIRNGKMEREDALRQVSEIKDKMNIDDHISFLRKLNISSSCINKVLK